MNWINEHKRNVRIAFLLLLALSIFGPWALDRINVPAPYACSSPHVRLDDEFCGLPLSITWFFSAIIGVIPYIVTGPATGAPSIGDASWPMLFFLCIFLLLLPLFSTTFLILRGDHRHWLILHKVGLGLATGIAGGYAGLGYLTSGWILRILWGLWLYILLTISLFALEAFVSRKPPRYMEESSPERTLTA